MNRVTWNTMRKNRVRTIVTIIGIVLSTAMFAAVLTLCTTFYKFMLDTEKAESGSYHINALNMRGADIKTLRNDERLEYAALTEVMGYAVFEGDEYLTSPLDLRSKFLWYKPEIAILTGIAWDHINVFPTFPEYVDTFRKFVATINRSLIYYDGDENLRKLAAEAETRIQCLPYHEYDGSIPMEIFGRHNMQNLQAACLACQQIGISANDFYREISTFSGASNRLEKIGEVRDMQNQVTRVAYKDFAHSPSKLKATVNAVRERYPNLKLVACMELHTFSSLMADFLPQYKNCMQEADVALVYFNPKVIEHKRLTPISKEDVAKAFGTENVEVYTESSAMQQHLKEMNYDHTALLMMSSGTFDGINIKEFANQLLIR